MILHVFANQKITGLHTEQKKRYIKFSLTLRTLYLNIVEECTESNNKT